MAPGKIPEAEDRGEAVVAKPTADVIDLDAERRRRAAMRPDSNGNHGPGKSGSDSDGAQNEPI